MNNDLIQFLPLHLRAETDEYPYFMIGEYFSYTDLPGCREWMHNWFKAAFAPDFIFTGIPGEFLDSANRLRLLLYACHLLLEKPEKKPYILMEKHREQLESVKRRREVIIKFLSLKEVANPHAVIQGFFLFKNLKAWLLTVQLWETAALNKTSITKLEDANALLPVMEHLYRVAEAAWMIWICG